MDNINKAIEIINKAILDRDILPAPSSKEIANFLSDEYGYAVLDEDTEKVLFPSDIEKIQRFFSPASSKNK